MGYNVVYSISMMRIILFGGFYFGGKKIWKNMGKRPFFQVAMV